jgi:hypothetical protein
MVEGYFVTCVVLLLGILLHDIVEIEVGENVLVQVMILEDGFEFIDDGLSLQSFRSLVFGLVFGLVHFGVFGLGVFEGGPVNVVIIQVVVELADDLLLLFANLELIDVYSVLPDLAA